MTQIDPAGTTSGSLVKYGVQLAFSPIPSGLLLGAKFSLWDYLIWNEIPTVIGNLVGGLSFTGLTLYATHIRTAPKAVRLLD